MSATVAEMQAAEELALSDLNETPEEREERERVERLMAAALTGEASFKEELAKIVPDDDQSLVTMTAAKRIKVERKEPAKKIDIEQLRTLADSIITANYEKQLTTLEPKALDAQQQAINSMSRVLRLLPYMPTEPIEKPLRFGHAISERFGFITPHVPGLNEGGTHYFWNNVYETSNPFEIAELRRLIAEGEIEGGEDTLVELDAHAEAYFDRLGNLLGWEKPNSVNVRRWAKQKMLKGQR